MPIHHSTTVIRSRNLIAETGEEFEISFLIENPPQHEDYDISDSEGEDEPLVEGEEDIDNPPEDEDYTVSDSEGEDDEPLVEGDNEDEQEYYEIYNDDSTPIIKADPDMPPLEDHTDAFAASPQDNSDSIQDTRPLHKRNRDELERISDEFMQIRDNIRLCYAPRIQPTGFSPEFLNEIREKLQSALAKVESMCSL